jgi:hypothetical protein
MELLLIYCLYVDCHVSDLILYYFVYFCILVLTLYLASMLLSLHVNKHELN